MACMLIHCSCSSLENTTIEDQSRHNDNFPPCLYTTIHVQWYSTARQCEDRSWNLGTTACPILPRMGFCDVLSMSKHTLQWIKATGGNGSSKLHDQRCMHANKFAIFLFDYILKSNSLPCTLLQEFLLSTSKATHLNQFQAQPCLTVGSQVPTVGTIVLCRSQ